MHESKSGREKGREREGSGSWAFKQYAVAVHDKERINVLWYAGTYTCLSTVLAKWSIPRCTRFCGIRLAHLLVAQSTQLAVCAVCSPTMVVVDGRGLMILKVANKQKIIEEFFVFLKIDEVVALSSECDGTRWVSNSAVDRLSMASF